MNIYDSSSWVIRYFHYKIPIIEAFSTLFREDRTKSKDEWLYFLIDQGMVPITSEMKREWIKWRQQLDIAELTGFIKTIKHEFSGPNANLYLFPLNRSHKKIMEDLDGKNGCTFPNYVLLFWKEQLVLSKQKALLLHEYHHVARLHHRKETERTISLLESMVMEGLAEWEVKNRLGEDHTAPWTTLYSKQELMKWWHRLFKENINLSGRTLHYPFLFGGIGGSPPWIGYQLGYYIINEFMKYNQKLDSISLLKMPANQFLIENEIFDLDLKTRF
ncbi:DUF2268 domain-containing protein [Salipaludibacillus sp. HK11]|uniref:DUF2268 domain-containing protein n=1 Tax=Salipaludibacillus sp. HK11 TaxID=3394320 RepID=UPI0039FD936A